MVGNTETTRQPEFRSTNQKPHVPDTFQLGAIWQFSAFVASRKINNLRVFNRLEYSDSHRRYLFQMHIEFWRGHHNCTLGNALPLDNGYVAVHGEVCEALNARRWRWPANLEPINFGGGSEAKNFSRIVRGEIAAPASFETRTFLSACPPGKARADSVPV